MYLITTKCKIKKPKETQNYLCVHICKTKKRAIETLNEYFAIGDEFDIKEAIKKNTKELQKEIYIKTKEIEKKYTEMKKQWPEHFKEIERKLNIKIEKMEF